MIIKTFEYSVAAAAASTNVCPSDFNPTPSAGILDVYATLDGGITGPLTVPPKIEVVVGGDTPQTPVRTSSVTGSPAQAAGTTAQAGNFTDPAFCPVVTGLVLRAGVNLSINLSGGTGATATGRIRMVYRSAQEAQSGAGAAGLSL